MSLAQFPAGFPHFILIRSEVQSQLNHFLPTGSFWGYARKSSCFSEEKDYAVVHSLSIIATNLNNLIDI